MIPPQIVRFIEERANAGFAGTRDKNLVPCGHRVPGWHIEAGGKTLVVFIPAESATRVLEDVENRGPVAITFEEVGTHETYQVKGRYAGHRPVASAEIEIVNRLRDRFVKGLRALYGDDRISDFVRASIPTPSLALALEVLEVFVQTPGPGAGARIAPPADDRVPVRSAS